MPNENKCQGLMGRIFGHKFSAIFHRIRDTTKERDAINDGYDFFTLIYPENKIYAGSVCQRCGKFIAKESK